MARVFTITTPSSTIPLDAKGRGEMAFTVANASGRTLRGRVSVVPQGAAQSAGLTLSGEPERDFPVGGVQQFTVQVTVPPATKEGSYTFRLDACSVQNPDEDYTQGPTVSFAVAKHEERGHFPWWIVIAAAAVLVVGGVLWWILSTKKVAVPDVTKQSLSQATTTLTGQQLKVGTVTDETGAAATSGTVSSQSPAAGTQVAANSAVNLVVKSATTPTILAVGVDHQLYTRMKIKSPWVGIPTSCCVIGVAQLKDGTFLGVGTDNLLYTRATLTSTWQQVPGSGAVIRAIQMSNGTILGVGTDHRLYTRATLTSAWQQIVPDTGGRVYDVAQFSDGTFLGIGLGYDLFTLATLTGYWVNIPSSGSVIAITVMPDGTILGVGTNNWLFTRSTTISTWVQVPNSGTVIAVAAIK